jgi:predicted  nucleic acid-binding Zn-ribbon protein
MRSQSIRFSTFLLLVLFAFSVCAVDAGAQSRRKRRPRRVTRPAVVRPVITNPAIAAPGSEQATGPDGERIISTAEEGSAESSTSESSPAKNKTSPKTANEGIQQTINSLSNQVDRLNDKLTEMQENDRTLIDMERLTRAEQRSESLRTQQIDVESKLADLQSKLELIEYQLKPENIERAAGYGTLHPEEARDSRRRQLENERARAQAQVRILETSRTRLETAVRTADAEVDALRQKIELQQATKDTSGTTTSEPRTRRPIPEQ